MADIKELLANTKEITQSRTVQENLMNFERVLDHINLYVFSNWIDGELVEGPDVKKYWVTCIFMWPYSKMPDPRGGKKLLNFGCEVKYKKDWIKMPIEIKKPSDFEDGTKYPRMIKKKIWLVEVSIPQKLIKDISRGSLEIEDETIDMSNLDKAIDKDVDDEMYQSENSQESLEQPGGEGEAETNVGQL